MTPEKANSQETRCCQAPTISHRGKDSGGLKSPRAGALGRWGGRGSSGEGRLHASTTGGTRPLSLVTPKSVATKSKPSGRLWTSANRNDQRVSAEQSSLCKPTQRSSAWGGEHGGQHNFIDPTLLLK